MADLGGRVAFWELGTGACVPFPNGGLSAVCSLLYSQIKTPE